MWYLRTNVPRRTMCRGAHHHKGLSENLRELKVVEEHHHAIMAPPDLIVRGRIEDARRVRAAEATAAAAASRSNGGGRSKGVRRGKKNNKMKKGSRKR